MGKPIVRCSRCNRRMRSTDGWNATMSRGVAVGYICPTCQTPEDNAEAEINEATLDYGLNPFGRVVGRPKLSKDTL